VTLHRATLNRATVNRRQFTGRHLTGATDNSATLNRATVIIIIIYLLRQMAAHIKYTNQYTKKHTIHSIKENYRLGLQFIHCYKKIAVSTKCRRKLRFSSATPESRGQAAEKNRA